MKKVLILASVASMIEQFNIPNIELLIEMGYNVDVACNFIDGNTCSSHKIKKLIDKLDFLNVKHYQIDFQRNVMNIKKNIVAYKQVEILMAKNQYSFVHCHSPIGGIIARIAGKLTDTKVIYTAHGFHFYKGAPLKNWILYYPIEWLTSFFTDTLITINQEDYAFAKKHMHAKRIEYIPGVGVGLDKFKCTNYKKTELRKELGVPDDAILLISVGELNENKNHETVIKAINGMDVYYIIVGKGNKKEYLQKLIDKQNMSERIKLLGFRDDVEKLYHASDIFVFPSYREGLSLSLMEAMASGLPCVVSKIRGNVDLINENGGCLCSSYNSNDFANAIESLKNSSELRIRMGEHNKKRVNSYSMETVLSLTEKIYTIEGKGNE